MSEAKREPGNGAVIVEVASRRFVVPFECPCCGAVPDAELAVPVARAPGRTVAADSARHLEFPYCERCVAHATMWDAAGVVSAAVMLSGIIASLALVVAGQFVIGTGVFLVAFALASVLVARRRRQARAACGPACASPSVAVAYLGWSGSTSAFAFHSPTYTARFAEHNTGDLANVGAPLRRLLDGHRVARLAVPTPAAAATVPPPLDASGWTAKIAAAPTRVARRHHLRVALELVHDPDEQRELVRTAMRAELAPVLAELERLRGGARRAYVEQQLAVVRADNLPPALQAATVAALEAQLAPP